MDLFPRPRLEIHVWWEAAGKIESELPGIRFRGPRVGTHASGLKSFAEGGDVEAVAVVIFRINGDALASVLEAESG